MQEGNRREITRTALNRLRRTFRVEQAEAATESMKGLCVPWALCKCKCGATLVDELTRVIHGPCDGRSIRKSDERATNLL